MKTFEGAIILCAQIGNCDLKMWCLILERQRQGMSYKHSVAQSLTSKLMGMRCMSMKGMCQFYSVLTHSGAIESWLSALEKGFNFSIRIMNFKQNQSSVPAIFPLPCRLFLLHIIIILPLPFFSSSSTSSSIILHLANHNLQAIMQKYSLFPILTLINTSAQTLQLKFMLNPLPPTQTHMR